MDWADLIRVPSVSLISGKRGSGKSALGYYLLEEISEHHHIIPAVIGLPLEKKSLLPENFIVGEGFDDMPEDAIVLIDEAALWTPARRSMSNLNLMVSNMVSLSRQRNQAVVFISHVMRKLDIAVVMELDAILLKEPSKLHSKFDRVEIRPMVESARRAFTKIKGDRREYTYVICEDFEGMMQNLLPSFWREELSRAFAGISIEETMTPSPTPGYASSGERIGFYPDANMGGSYLLVTADMRQRRVEVKESHQRSGYNTYYDPITGIHWVERIH